jgi:hypothetical protein
MRQSLPRPTDKTRRDADAIRDIAASTAPRLLYVSSVASGLVVLKEADGTIISESIAYIGTIPPQVGDSVVRIAIPGRGDKHAKGSYVAVGPINRVSGAVGIIERTASATNSATASTSSTSTYSVAITLSITLPPGTWEISAHGTIALIHSASGKADVEITIDGTAVSRQTPNLSSSVYGRFGSAQRLTGIAGNRTITITVEFKSFGTGTTTCAQPIISARAMRIA